ncbi:zonular occludens toxin domain-containing protein, partial [Vibrio cholerae]|uniref:zonular occludens toxin domain-containing protein n=1 Tax=Vibrio cholerae TaxID=666 RepID=UPI001F07C04C
MLHGFSGSPGTGKTLNAIKFIIENDNFATCPIYYHGIRVLLLDFDACNSFEGWLYGVYYPANQHNTALKKKLLQIDQERRLATLDDFPYLDFEYSKHDPVTLWVTWFKRVASQHRLNLFNEALSVLKLEEDQLTGDIIKSLGLSWHRFDDPTKIHELPSGSVILVDEVQNIWPTRQSSKDPTPDVQFVSTHRHNAQNLVYVSQDFRDVDQFIRRRIAHYTHFEFLGGEWL